jgi:hypothetical protein
MHSSNGDAWRTFGTASLRDSCLRIARETAERLRASGGIESAIAASERQSAYSDVIRWQDRSVAQGYAGLAILWGYLAGCFPGEGFDVTGHRHLELAVRDAERSGAPFAGLFGGLGGLAFAAWRLSFGGERYGKLMAAIDEALLPRAVAMARALSAQGGGVSVGEFDVISGLSGVGACLLDRCDAPGPSVALQEILTCLVRLSREEGGIPRWYTPPHLFGDRQMADLFPQGNLNCGLAHGIPGPLALLALAKAHGVAVDGLDEALERLGDWVAGHREDDAWGINWPTAVPLCRDEATGRLACADPGTRSPTGPSRTAWCYGSPGVARALWLAGEALGRPDYCDLAIAAMEAVFRRPVTARQIDSPTFCHGVAGLLQITLRFARDTRLPAFEAAAADLCDQLLALYEPDSLLGFRSLELEGRRVDQPGLLDGAPGVALVLLAASTGVEPTWDRLFLLS